MLKTTLQHLFRITISVAILWFCFSRIEFSSFSLALSTISLHYLALAFLLGLIGSILIPALVSNAALQANKLDLTLSDLVKINFSIRFYTLIFPRGVASGIRWFKYKGDGSGQEALALMVFEKVIQVLILMFTATIFLWIDRDKLSDVGSYILIVSFLGFFAACMSTMFFFVKSFSAILLRILQFSTAFALKFIQDKLLKFWEAVSTFQDFSLLRILTIIGLSLLGYVFFILSPYVLSLAMDIPISIRAIIWIRSLVLMLAMIPITVAGLGVREAGYVSFMGLYGIAEHEALAFSIMLFLIQIMIGIIGALIEAWNHFILPFFKKLTTMQSVE